MKAAQDGRISEGRGLAGLLTLPFDQYQRHRLIHDAVEALRDGRARLSVLDVGGAPGLMREFLPRDRVVVVDAEGAAPAVDLRASGRHLPFGDRSFDLVVSSDTLEHVPSVQRGRFLGELIRVTGDALLLTAPFASPQVDEAESLLSRFLKDRLGMDHRFLSEHREHGLPVRDRVSSRLEEELGPVVSVPNGSLHRWLLMMALSFYLDRDPGLAALKEEVSAYYNRHYYRLDNAEPAYRHLLVSRRPPGAPLARDRFLPATTGTAAPDFSPMATLMEATLVDRLKEAYGSIEVLRAEIDSQQSHAANLVAVREELEGRVAELEAVARSLPVRILRKLGIVPRGG